MKLGGHRFVFIWFIVLNFTMKTRIKEMKFRVLKMKESKRVLIMGFGLE